VIKNHLEVDWLWLNKKFQHTLKQSLLAAMVSKKASLGVILGMSVFPF